MSTPTPDEPNATDSTHATDRTDRADSADSADSSDTAVNAAGAAVPPAAAAPFAAVPREPWVNPSRRRHVAGVGLVTALACLGTGIGIGWAASGDDHRDRPRNMIVFPDRGAGFGPGGFVPHGNAGMWPMPGHPAPDGTDGDESVSPSPAPSSTG